MELFAAFFYTKEMEYKKKVVIGSQTFVKGFGMMTINEANKQFFFNQGFKHLFKNDVKNSKVTTKQTSGDTKRTKKRGESK